jgi:hypothetical protein
MAARTSPRPVSSNWQIYRTSPGPMSALLDKGMPCEVGEDLTHIVRGGTVRPIAPVEQVLALEAQT